MNRLCKIAKKIIFLSSITIVLNNGYASEQSKSDVEKIGDAMLVLIPAATYGVTFMRDDSEGRNEFYKSTFANLGITYGLKYTVDAPRPANNGEHSFPSGHTSVTFQSAAFLHKRYGFSYAIPAYLSASFVGWSRVDSEQHYTKDVVAGAIIGTLTGFYFTSPYKNSTIVPIVQNDAVGFQLAYKW